MNRPKEGGETVKKKSLYLSKCFCDMVIGYRKTKFPITLK